MAKSKLKVALAVHKGKDLRREHLKKVQKKVSKTKKSKGKLEDLELEEDEDGGVALNGAGDDSKAVTADESEDDSDLEGPVIDTSRLDDSESDSEDDDLDRNEEDDNEEDDDDDDEDIPLSDIESLASNDRADILPHQRLTINNTTALLKSLKSIALPTATMPFSEHQSITNPSATTIPHIDDDLNRELAFYAQALSAATAARSLLQKEGQPFSRPTDYFAEMVKSDEHMGKVRDKMMAAAGAKKAAADARRQRDLRKFGKQVQVAKLQERDKAKRETLDKIKLLKRKRQGADPSSTHETDNLFDIALDDSTNDPRQSNSSRRGPASDGARGGKRQRRDQKFGFGGKKRFAKSGDAASSGDLSGFSARRMKGGMGRGGGRATGGGSKRLGKSRRAKVG